VVGVDAGRRGVPVGDWRAKEGTTQSGGRGGLIGGRAVPNLTIVVVTPALQRAAAGQCAGVVDSSLNRYHARGEAAYQGWRRCIPWRTDAQLSSTVETPAEHRASTGQRTVVV